mgnify:CR=1 FL=1|jgi:hypothetical protein
MARIPTCFARGSSRTEGAPAPRDLRPRSPRGEGWGCRCCEEVVDEDGRGRGIVVVDGFCRSSLSLALAAGVSAAAAARRLLDEARSTSAMTARAKKGHAIEQEERKEKRREDEEAAIEEMIFCFSVNDVDCSLLKKKRR